MVFLKLFHSFSFFFLFVPLTELFPVTLVHWYFVLLCLVCCCIPLMSFSVRLLCSLAPWFLFGSFQIFSISLLKFSLCSCIVLLILVSIFITLILNSLSDKSHNCFIRVSFWRLNVFLYLELLCWFFIFLYSLCWCLHITQSKYLSQSSWTD